jgi:hypothetical protein
MWWVMLGLLVLFFVWAGWRLRDRDSRGNGPQAEDGRHGDRGSCWSGGGGS